MTPTTPDHRPGPTPVGPRGLPRPIHLSSRLPWAETAVFVSVVPMLSLPVMLATMGARWAVLVAVLLTGAVAWLCLARHTALGHGWVADRRVWRYRVTHAAHLRAVEIVDTSHGGQLTLHPHHGRPHRLRTSALSTADARAAVGSVVAEGDATVCRGTRALLATGPALALR